MSWREQEIESWVRALEAYGQKEPDYATALAHFEAIGDNSKVLFNIGLIHATVGDHDKAIEAYHQAIKLDQYFAVAYFQLGVSNFLLGDFKEASANFNDSLLYLRGNTTIQYEQLGLKFTLFSCEVLFNRGLCRLYSAETPEDIEHKSGLQDLIFASKEKQLDAHAVIDEAINEGAEGFTVFSVPVGILFRPSDAKIKNFRQRDYLGEAKVIATSDFHNINTGFDGAEHRKKAGAEEAKSYAATNLVLADRSSKSISPLMPVPLRDVDFNPQYATPTASPKESSIDAPGMNTIRDSVVTFRTSSFDGESKPPVAPENLPPVEVTQLKIKIHFNQNQKLRLMLLSPDVDLEEFKARVGEKLNISGEYDIEVMDHDDKVAILDKEDLDAAIVTSKDSARRVGSAVGTIEQQYNVHVLTVTSPVIDLGFTVI
ncbi:hypothetical protein Dda_0767 [Drechslerella dactyloides]|uniref:NADPH oxidase regulator NoxR n=1 Tax=Drechslerella dactyloides TaxID=74499 RepID=A0AAD6J506_DREDA|nr:hypothetical protein Dda_0767 [Drechslerella dactyloides]